MVASCAAAVAVMAAAVAGGFVNDAAAMLERDPRFALPIDWSALLTSSYWLTGLWRPLTIGLFGLQAALPGEAIPAVFHATSILLYLVTTALVVRLAARLGAGPTPLLVAGILFAVHPLHAEVVASIVGQAELLTAIAMLGGALVWHRAAREGPGAATVPLLLLSQAAAIGAKEQGFVLIGLLVGQHLLFPGRLTHRRAATLLLPVGLLAAVLLLTRGMVTGSIVGETPLVYLAGLDLGARTVTALGVLPEIVRLAVLPLHLQAEYGPPDLPIGPPLGLRHLLGILVVLGWGIALLRARHRAPLTALGLWWIGVTWLPSSSLLAPAGVMLADRLLFLPSIGLALVVAGVVPDRPSVTGRLVLGGALAWAVLAGVRTVGRVATWRTPEAYFTQMTVDAPRVYRAWYFRGLSERDLGKHREAEAHLRHSLALWDRDPVVHDVLGQVLRTDGRCREAVTILRAGLALEPGRTQTRAKLGECLLETGDSVAARALAREGIALGQDAFVPLLRRAGGD